MKGGFNMKKILTIALAIIILATSSTFAYAKGRNVKHIPASRNKKHISTSLQKSLKAIAPKSTTGAAIDPAISMQITAVKNAYTNYITVAKQINTKKVTTIKLIKVIKTSKKTLTNAQYAALNALIAKISSETKGIVNVKELDKVINLIKVTKANSANKLATVTLAELTSMLNGITANTTHLTTISTTYDLINATLTTVVNTTPAAVSLN